ncbi:LON peptidase N-terminal domain and RING finger protein 3-like isoform X2 [Paramacrobiotus metropolitanus]|uniref:LON peptidase N-terminal domain and RING finger protein 3-like isoform X2 n=1 Tax=Paramacrobiotus metropolitanus TaxID=2943436 RepID=UPI0024456B3F|nr:LON peptidase N-terminal domain and RING finger protein 3-like isoform X2 [Paramacrobiotus metropolitanus]
MDLPEKLIKAQMDKLQEVDTLIKQKDLRSALLKYLDAKGALDGCIPYKNFSSFVRRFIDNISVDIPTISGSAETASESETDHLVYGLLSCGICKRILEVPVTLPCEETGHTFCKVCITALAQSGSSRCPTCQSRFSASFSEKANASFAVGRLVEIYFPDVARAYQLKREGNECFAANDHYGSLSKYNEAVRVGGPEASVLSNRSQLYFVLGNNEEAVSDADAAIELRPSWSKPYYRKALALFADAQFASCSATGFQMAVLDRENPQIRELLPKILWKYLTLESDTQDTMEVTTDTEGIADWCSKMVERFEEAVAVLTSLMNRCPKSASKEHAVDVGLDIVEEILTCTLCYRLLYKPVTPRCGHSFCKQCLHRVLDFKPSCPQCRSDLSDYLAEKRFATTEVLQKVCESLLPKVFEERVHMFNTEMQELARLSEDEAEIPVFVLTVAWPDIPLFLHVFEPRYRLMVRQALESGSNRFGMACAPPSEDNTTDVFADYGTILRIEHIEYEEDGRCFVHCKGERRFRVLSRSMREGYHTARVKYIADRVLLEDEILEVRALEDEYYGLIEKELADLDSATLAHLTDNIGPFPAKGDLSVHTENGPPWIWWYAAFTESKSALPSWNLNLLKETSVKARLQMVHHLINRD